MVSACPLTENRYNEKLKLLWPDRCRIDGSKARPKTGKRVRRVRPTAKQNRRLRYIDLRWWRRWPRPKAKKAFRRLLCVGHLQLLECHLPRPQLRRAPAKRTGQWSPPTSSGRVPTPTLTLGILSFSYFRLISWLQLGVGGNLYERHKSPASHRVGELNSCENMNRTSAHFLLEETIIWELLLWRLNGLGTPWSRRKLAATKPEQIPGGWLRDKEAMPW